MEVSDYCMNGVDSMSMRICDIICVAAKHSRFHVEYLNPYVWMRIWSGICSVNTVVVFFFQSLPAAIFPASTSHPYLSSPSLTLSVLAVQSLFHSPALLHEVTDKTHVHKTLYSFLYNTSH